MSITKGWALVPTELTKEMATAYVNAPGNLYDAWTAMVAAAPKPPLNEGRFVVCAACRYGEMIICGARHFDPTMHTVIEQLREDKLFAFEVAGRAEQGFIDQWGVFMDREEAFLVAQAAGQINVRRAKSSHPDSTTLFSEDLY